LSNRAERYDPYTGVRDRSLSRALVSGEAADGWRAYLIAGDYEANEVIVICPECADREFGREEGFTKRLTKRASV
jgi:hypothetical protein